MKGIEKAEIFYTEYGINMLKSDFPDLLPRLAAGIAGRGSECFGYDDEVSSDHDFFPGFTIWLSDRDEEKYGFKLSCACNELLRIHAGCGKIQRSCLGTNERKVMRITDFFRHHLGFSGAPESWRQWLYTPEYAFAEVLNGKIFYDGSGEFSGIRKQIASSMPEDVRRKKIAARAIMIAQSGQYNFARCLKHGEYAAAEIALAEFAQNCVSLIFLLNRRFAPYYKWMFRALAELPVLPSVSSMLKTLLTGKNPPDQRVELIENICAQIISELAVQQLSTLSDSYLEPHAFAVLDGIVDRELRSMHIMEG